MRLSQPLATTLMATTFLALGPSLSPASAANLTVTDVTVGKGPISFTIPRIDVTDGNMTEADIRSAFSGEDLAAISKSVSTWDAASIVIPEMSFRQVVKSPDNSETTAETTYRDFKIENLQDGVAQSTRLEGGEMKISGKEPFTATFGAMSSGLIDLGALAGLYAGGGGGETKTIYKDAVLEGATLTDPQGASCEIGRIVASEFKARPFGISPVEFVTLAQSMEGNATPSPADIQKIVAFYGDILQGMDVSPVTADGISCKFVEEHGDAVDFSIGKMEFEGFGKGRYGAVTMNDFDMTIGDQGFVRAGKLVFKEIDLNSVLDTLHNAGSDLTPAWFEQNFRKLIPSFDGFTMEDVSVDVPDPENPTLRHKVGVDAFDVTLKGYRLGIPTEISITTDNSKLELPADSTEEGLRQLREMGYDSLEMDSAIKLHWDEASSTIVVDEFSWGGVDMGSFNLTGVIGNAGEALFSADPQLMQMAAMGLAVKEMSVSTQDDGLADKIFAMVGKEQGQDPAAVRTQMSGVAAGMIPMFLGGTEQAQNVANAVMTFLNGGSSLKVTATAKDAAGLGLMDFIAAQQNPAAIVEKLDIEAEAK